MTKPAPATSRATSRSSTPVGRESQAGPVPIALALRDQLVVIEIAERIVAGRLELLESKPPRRAADVPRVLAELAGLANESLRLAEERQVVEREISIVTGACPAEDAPN